MKERESLKEKFNDKTNTHSNDKPNEKNQCNNTLTDLLIYLEKENSMKPNLFYSSPLLILILVFVFLVNTSIGVYLINNLSIISTNTLMIVVISFLIMTLLLSIIIVYKDFNKGNKAVFYNVYFILVKIACDVLFHFFCIICVILFKQESKKANALMILVISVSLIVLQSLFSVYYQNKKIYYHTYSVDNMYSTNNSVNDYILKLKVNKYFLIIVFILYLILYIIASISTYNVYVTLDYSFTNNYSENGNTTLKNSDFENSTISNNLIDNTFTMTYQCISLINYDDYIDSKIHFSNYFINTYYYFSTSVIINDSNYQFSKSYNNIINLKTETISCFNYYSYKTIKYLFLLNPNLKFNVEKEKLNSDYIFEITLCIFLIVLVCVLFTSIEYTFEVYMRKNKALYLFVSNLDLFVNKTNDKYLLIEERKDTCNNLSNEEQIIYDKLSIIYSNINEDYIDNLINKDYPTHNNNNEVNNLKNSSQDEIDIKDEKININNSKLKLKLAKNKENHANNKQSNRVIPSDYDKKGIEKYSKEVYHLLENMMLINPSLFLLNLITNKKAITNLSFKEVIHLLFAYFDNDDTISAKKNTTSTQIQIVDNNSFYNKAKTKESNLFTDRDYNDLGVFILHSNNKLSKNVFKLKVRRKINNVNQHYKKNDIEDINNLTNLYEFIIENITSDYVNNDILKENNHIKLSQKMFSKMTHEFKTPLIIIKSLITELIDPEIEDKTKITAYIYYLSDYITYLINDIIYSSNNSDIVTQIEEINIFEILDFCEGVTESLINVLPGDRKNLCVRTDIASNVSNYKIFSDTAKIKQVLLNIISNSVKFTKNGEIYIFAVIIENELQAYNNNFDGNYNDKEIKDSIPIDNNKVDCDDFASLNCGAYDSNFTTNNLINKNINTDSNYKKTYSNCFQFDISNKQNSTLQSTTPKIFKPYLKIVIQDSGIGIKDEDLAKIRIESENALSINKDYAFNSMGTGIGLCITKKIIKALKHEFNITSTYGKGTTTEVIIKSITKNSFRITEDLSASVSGPSKFGNLLISTSSINNNKKNSKINRVIGDIPYSNNAIDNSLYSIESSNDRSNKDTDHYGFKDNYSITEKNQQRRTISKSKNYDSSFSSKNEDINDEASRLNLFNSNNNDSYTETTQYLKPNDYLNSLKNFNNFKLNTLNLITNKIRKISHNLNLKKHHKSNSMCELQKPDFKSISNTIPKNSVKCFKSFKQLHSISDISESVSPKIKSKENKNSYYNLKASSKSSSNIFSNSNENSCSDVLSLNSPDKTNKNIKNNDLNLNLNLYNSKSDYELNDLNNFHTFKFKVKNEDKDVTSSNSKIQKCFIATLSKYSNRKGSYNKEATEIKVRHFSQSEKTLNSLGNKLNNFIKLSNFDKKEKLLQHKDSKKYSLKNIQSKIINNLNSINEIDSINSLFNNNNIQLLNSNLSNNKRNTTIEQLSPKIIAILPYSNSNKSKTINSSKNKYSNSKSRTSNVNLEIIDKLNSTLDNLNSYKDSFHHEDNSKSLVSICPSIKKDKLVAFESNKNKIREYNTNNLPLPKSNYFTEIKNNKDCNEIDLCQINPSNMSKKVIKTDDLYNTDNLVYGNNKNRCSDNISCIQTEFPSTTNTQQISNSTKTTQTINGKNISKNSRLTTIKDNYLFNTNNLVKSRKSIKNNSINSSKNNMSSFKVNNTNILNSNNNSNNLPLLNLLNMRVSVANRKSPNTEYHNYTCNLTRPPIKKRSNSQLLLNLNKKKIIVADDTDSIRKSIRKLLLKNSKILTDFEIIEVKDGIEILNQIVSDQTEGNKIKMIITDENMEYMSGSAAISILKNLEKDSKIKSVYIASLTAFDSEDTKNSILNKGADIVLKKPIEFSELNRMIELSNILKSESSYY